MPSRRSSPPRDAVQSNRDVRPSRGSTPATGRRESMAAARDRQRPPRAIRQIIRRTLVSTRRATEDAFLGALLGLAIGDALGMPRAGESEKAGARQAPIDSYLPRHFADGVEIAAGEFTDESEIALSIVESMTVNGGA